MTPATTRATATDERMTTALAAGPPEGAARAGAVVLSPAD